MRIRLFPLVLVAAIALLFLKSLGLLTQGSYVLTGTQYAGAAGVTGGEKRDEPKVVGSEAKMATTPPVHTNEIKGDTPTIIDQRAESQLYERLGDRRRDLEEKQRELEMRETLIKAAEKRLEEKTKELRSVEGNSPTSEGKKADRDQLQIKGLVTMYENMKPKDAARIFNRLSLDVLLPVVDSMNPRKMADVLAEMDSAAAERLTVEIASRARRAQAASNPRPEGADRNYMNLPKIESKPGFKQQGG